MLAGAVIGCLNGLVISKPGLTPIVTTIAMNGLLFGAILLSFTVGGALVLGQVATLVAVLNLGSNIQQLIYGAIILVVIWLYGRRSAAR